MLSDTCTEYNVRIHVSISHAINANISNDIQLKTSFLYRTFILNKVLARLCYGVSYLHGRPQANQE